MSIPAHFWGHVLKSDDCWTWTGSISHDGYGRAGTHKVFGTSLPHRVTWQDVNGAIADGLELDHLCNNRACVRPDHLEPVTHAENVRRRYERRETCPNGHPINSDTRVSHYGTEIGDRCLPCRRKANREHLRRERAKNTPVGQIVTYDVRVWAWANGLPCKVMGQLPKVLVAAYLAAHEDAAA